MSLFVGRTLFLPSYRHTSILGREGNLTGTTLLAERRNCQKLVKMVQSTLQLAGIDPSGYSGHRTNDQNQTIP